MSTSHLGAHRLFRSIRWTSFLAIALCGSFVVPSSILAKNLRGNAKSRVCEAIQILKDYDACCKVKSPDGFAPGISVSACLEKIKKNNNLCVRNLGSRVLGRKTLDDRSADCTGNDIIYVSSRLIGSNKSRRSFVKLLSVLYHEGTHALQDLTGISTSNYADKKTGPIEVQAWQNNKYFNEVFKAALQKVLDNLENDREAGDGLSDCQRKLMACFLTTSETRLKSMIREACRLNSLSCRTIDGIKRWLARNCPPSRPSTGSPRHSSRESSSGLRYAVAVPDDERVLILEDDPVAEEIGEFDLFTGLDEIFGMSIQEDDLGLDHLIVAGQRNGVGILQEWVDSTPNLDPMQLVGEIVVDAVTSAPSGLVPLGTEFSPHLLIWDEIQGELFLFEDTDDDGVADTLDPTPRYELPFPGTDYSRLSLLDDQTYLLERTAIGSSTGNLTVIKIFDGNDDGVFSFTEGIEILPLDDPDRSPALISELSEGATSIFVAGATGHDLQLWQTDGAGGLIAPYGVPVSVVAENRAELDLGAPLALGTFAKLLDLTNGTENEELQVVPFSPRLDHALGNLVPGPGGEVGQFADLRGATVADVLVGGQPVESFFATDDFVQYLAPPNVPVPGDGVSDRGHVVDVKVLLDTGSRGILALEASALAYSEPFLTAEYEVRKGNINGGVGPVQDVVLVNGSAGIGNARQVFVALDEPFTLDVAKPDLAVGSSAFALFAWVGEPEETTVKSLPGGTGSIGKATPLQGGCPGQPVRIANNTGVGVLGSENWPGGPTSPAPTRLLDLGGGVGLAGKFTFQAVMLDPGAPNGLAGVSNAVIVISE